MFNRPEFSLHDPGEFQAAVLDRPGTVLLDDRPAGQKRGVSYLLQDPVEIILAESREEVGAALARLDHHLQNGRFVAGYLAYDAGLGLDKPLSSRHVTVHGPGTGSFVGPFRAENVPVPLTARRGQSHFRGLRCENRDSPRERLPHEPAVPRIWLGAYDVCRAFEAQRIDLGPPDSPADVMNPRLNLAEDQYLAAVRRIQEYIAAGDVYQINYTCKLRFEHARPSRCLFSRLRNDHPVCHSAWINTGPFQVISLSPELFLRREGTRVSTRPMKGTARRGRWSDEDEALARALAADQKNRAENVMIVDLMRNDLGRICRPGTVRVAKALHVEHYRSLLQMTSEVSGCVPEETSAEGLLRATFPPGSVTGAPKLRAMEIIDSLESEARGVYTGAIGLFCPGGDCLLNVAIRTVVKEGDRCEMGLGSGIVADSDPRAEWDEVQLKGRFLLSEHRRFELLETMLVLRGQPPQLFEEHLRRLRLSAAYFGWEFPEPRIRGAVEQATADATADCRLRLLLDEEAQVRVERAPLEPPGAGPAKAMLAPRRTDPDDPLLYHKTTARDAYDAGFREARSHGCFDVVYCNTRGDVTEGAITNLFAQIDGVWYTPSLDCGLLPGIWRAVKLAQGTVRERRIPLDDLLRATRIVLGNSVRGDVEITALLEPAGGKPVWGCLP